MPASTSRSRSSWIARTAGWVWTAWRSCSSTRAQNQRRFCRRSARLRLGPDLLLFRKALHTLEGVEADIGAGASRVDDVLLGEFLRHLASEWPQRWLALPGCRAFATRLSNADLAQMMLRLPWAAARFWLVLASELLRPGRPATGAC